MPGPHPKLPSLDAPTVVFSEQRSFDDRGTVDWTDLLGLLAIRPLQDTGIGA